VRALVVALVIVGCGAPAAEPDAGHDASAAIDAAVDDAGAPGCEGSLDPVVCSGAVDPTTLGAGIEAVPAGLAGSEPGSHWYCAPGEGTAWNGRVLLYLVGTFGDPRTEHAFAARACALGFVAIAPMYENRLLVRSVCGEDGDCYEHFHEEIVDGTDVAASPVDVDLDDSIRNRAATLIAHLASEGEPWTTVRDRLMAGDWSNVVLAGHSQGAGQVAYLAREESAERVVMLAGPADQLGDGTPMHTPPPWIAALETAPLRTSLRLAYIHDDDSFEVVSQVASNWDAMGVADGTCVQSTSGGYDASCRRIRIASDGCAGLAAHLTVILDRWGAACRAGPGEHTNVASWDHLLMTGR
jgi:hypothetical protein